MNRAFDELERQLATAVRSGRAARRRVCPRRAAAVVLVALLAVSAAAIAATRGATDRTARIQGDALALRVWRDTAGNQACRLVGATAARGIVLSQGVAASPITRLLPALGRGVSSGERDATMALLARARAEGVLFASSIRTVRVAPFLELLVAVGARQQSVRDPEACTDSRVADARRLAGGLSAGALERALWRLRSDPAAAPGVQTLYVFELPRPLPHGEIMGGGGADPVSAAHPLHPGITLVSNEPDGSRVLVGLARPAARQVELRAATLHHKARTQVVEGFFAVRVPHRVGRFSIVELAANGSVIGPVNLSQ